MAQSASFWDSGEFIAVSYNLGVTHPSGAPLYILIGNFFTSLFFFISDVGARVNLLSVFCSAFSVTLLYLIIVHFIKNWYKTKSKVIFKHPKTLKTEEVDVSRLIRVFVNNFESHKRSVK